MAKHEIIYACGHEDIVELFGNVKTREWKLERMQEEDCPECQAEKRRQALKQKEQEEGLPELEGTSKQVEWARKIRMDSYELLDQIFDLYEGTFRRRTRELDEDKKTRRAKEKEADKNSFCDMIYSQTSASWWIDHRKMLSNISFKELFYDYCEHHDDVRERLFPSSQKLEEKKEDDLITLYPEDEETKTICTIRIAGNEEDNKRMVYVFSAKDNYVINLMHGIPGMSWDGNKKAWGNEWLKDGLYSSETPEDMLVEIATMLLQNGVPISTDRKDLEERIKSGDYKKRTFHWISTNMNKTQLLYKFYMFDEKIAADIRSIPGTEYNSFCKHYVLDVNNYDAIRDVAMKFNMGITYGAENLMNNAEEEYKKRLIVTPGKKKSKIEKTKNSDTDIHANLLIEDEKAM